MGKVLSPIEERKREDTPIARRSFLGGQSLWIARLHSATVCPAVARQSPVSRLPPISSLQVTMPTAAPCYGKSTTGERLEYGRRDCSWEAM